MIDLEFHTEKKKNGNVKKEQKISYNEPAHLAQTNDPIVMFT